MEHPGQGYLFSIEDLMALLLGEGLPPYRILLPGKSDDLAKELAEIEGVAENCRSIARVSYCVGCLLQDRLLWLGAFLLLWKFPHGISGSEYEKTDREVLDHLNELLKCWNLGRPHDTKALLDSISATAKLFREMLPATKEKPTEQPDDSTATSEPPSEEQ